MANFREQICNIIGQVEQRYPVLDLTYNGLPIWSVVRAAIGREAENHFLNSGRLVAAGNERLEETQQSLEKLAQKFGFSQSQGLTQEAIAITDLAKDKSRADTDILFFSWPERSYHHNRNGRFNQEDYLFDLIDDSLHAEKIEFASHKTPSTFPRWKKITLVEQEQHLNNQLFKSWVLFNYPFSLRHQWGNIEILRQITKYLRLNYSSVFRRGLFFKLIFEVEYVWQHSLQIEKVILAISPKAIVSNIYYNRDAISCLFAAKRQGIPFVEVINGAIGKYHWAYTQGHYHVSLAQNMVPDVFWVWDEQTKEYVTKFAEREGFTPSVIVGGNIRYEHWKRENHKQKKLTKDKRVYRVLFTHQYVNIVPPHLVEAILGCGQEIEWVFRLHPQSSMLKEVYEAFFDKMPQNVTVELSTDVSIFERLADCDHLVTEFSTTAIEALNFQIPVTLISDVGASLFENYLAGDDMMLALNSKELIANIRYYFENKNYPTDERADEKHALEVVTNIISQTSCDREKLQVNTSVKKAYKITIIVRAFHYLVCKGKRLYSVFM